jgi:hypothetical protein
MMDRLTPALLSLSRRLRLAVIALMLALAFKTGAAALAGPGPAPGGVLIERSLDDHAAGASPGAQRSTAFRSGSVETLEDSSQIEPTAGPS